MKNVTVPQIEEFSAMVLSWVGIPEGDAKITAHILAQADLRGIDSHGVARLPIYVKRIRLGLINKEPEIKIVGENAGLAVVDGDNGLGQVVANHAMKLCLRKARENGVSFVAVKNSNHFGIGAYYAMMALEEDMIGIVGTNTSPLMAPFGGKEPLLGTNPIAVAVPTKEEHPVVLDMATSLVPRGKIEIYARKGEKLPLGWAIDADGRPTQEPEEALKGTLLPMGGPKGYGLSMVVDLLAGAVAGAAVGGGVGSLFGNMERPQNVGHFMLAVDVGAIRNIDEFKSAMDEYVCSVKNSPPAEGVKEIFLPGEIEFLRAEERREKGVVLNPEVVKNLLAMAKEIGMLGPDATEDELF